MNVRFFRPNIVNVVHHIWDIAQSIIKQKEKMIIVMPAINSYFSQINEEISEISGRITSSYFQQMAEVQEKISHVVLDSFLENKTIKTYTFDYHSYGVIPTDCSNDIEKTLQFLHELRFDLAMFKDFDVVLIPQFRHFKFFESIDEYQNRGCELSAMIWSVLFKLPLIIYDAAPGISRVISYYKKSHNIIPYLSYIELIELNTSQNILSNIGLEFAYAQNLQIEITNIHNIDSGTIITKKENIDMPFKTITSIHTDNNQVQVNWENLPMQANLLSLIFNRFAQSQINIDMISYLPQKNGKFNCAFTISRENMGTAHEIIYDLKKEFKDSESFFEEDVTKVNLLGLGMTDTPGVAAKVFSILDQANILVQMITTSEVKISILIRSIDEQQTIKLLRKEFEL